MALDAQYIVLTVYASVYVLIVILIGIYVYWQRNYKDKPTLSGNASHQSNQKLEKYRPDTYFEAVWLAREIYTAAVVHIYDQCTDIAVMVQWGGLLYQEKILGENVKNVDMYSFFLPGLLFIVLYRVISMFFIVYNDTRYMRAKRKLERDNVPGHDLADALAAIPKKLCTETLFDLVLAGLDLYFLKVVYLEFKAGDFRPNQAHRSLQLVEALFESMPQVVLQSVFLLRYTAVETNDEIGITLIVVSIVASILSIANKYAWFDQQAVVFDAKEFNGGRRGECYVSWRFLLRTVWRWSDLCTRFVIFLLLWVIIGGIYMLVYFVACFLLYYFIVLDRIKMGDENVRWYRLLATTICFVGVILDWEWHFCILRLVDNSIMIAIIAVFGFARFDCGDFGCSDNASKDAWNTPIIVVFVVLGIATLIVEFVTYPVIQSKRFNIIKKTLKGREFFSIILFGDESSEIPCYYLTYFVESRDAHSNNNGMKVEDIVYFSTKRSVDDCEKLGEALEDVFKDDDNVTLHTGDIAIDSKSCKVFKYGMSIKCLQNVYTSSDQQRFGDEAYAFIEELYRRPANWSRVLTLIEQHFSGRDLTQTWTLRFSRDDGTFIVPNIDENYDANVAAAMDDEYGAEGYRLPVVQKYRFGGDDAKKYRHDVRVISGREYDKLHDDDAQVMIKVIDRNTIIAGKRATLTRKRQDTAAAAANETYSAKNMDLFAREILTLRVLNEAANRRGILPYYGWDDAPDAYFIVTKRLFGEKLLDRIIRRQQQHGLSEKRLLLHIRNMFEVVQLVHAQDIAMRKLDLNSFQFDFDDDADDGRISMLHLTHYEHSRVVKPDDERRYGNLSGKVVFMSPEMCASVRQRMKHKKWSQDLSGKMYLASDVWSLGIMAYYLIFGRHPFYQSKVRHSKLKRTLRDIEAHTRFDFAASKLEPFKLKRTNALCEEWLNMVLHGDYRQRCTIGEALEHEFLSRAFLDALDESCMMDGAIVEVLKQKRNVNALKEAICSVRVEQWKEQHKKLELKFDDDEDAGGDIEDIDAMITLQKTDTHVERLMSVNRIEDLRQQFKRCDIDGNNYATVEELVQLLSSLGFAKTFAKKEAQKIMQELDLNGDGVIDFGEFATAWEQHQFSANDKYAHAVFNVFDENGDGYIDANELKAVLFADGDDDAEIIYKEEKNADDDDDEEEEEYVIGEDDYFPGAVVNSPQNDSNGRLKQIIREVDTDGDGRISFDEFCKAMIEDAEQQRSGSGDVVPFVQVFADIEFKEINEHGNDVLFQNNADYITLEDLPSFVNNASPQIKPVDANYPVPAIGGGGVGAEAEEEYVDNVTGGAPRTSTVQKQQQGGGNVDGDGGVDIQMEMQQQMDADYMAQAEDTNVAQAAAGEGTGYLLTAAKSSSYEGTGDEEEEQKIDEDLMP